MEEVLSILETNSREPYQLVGIYGTSVIGIVRKPEIATFIPRRQKPSPYPRKSGPYSPRPVGLSNKVSGPPFLSIDTLLNRGPHLVNREKSYYDGHHV